MSSPWAKIQPVEGPTSLLEITSEQLATSLQQKEMDKYFNVSPEGAENFVVDTEEDVIVGETDSDQVIAHLLQNQYNQEYDRILQSTEKKFNRDSKVNITYSNYKTSTSNNNNESKTVDEKKDFDRFVSLEKEYASIPRCGYKKTGEGSNVITKHDMLMSSRINACRVLQFPPGIHTGDTGGFDVKLNNKVFNGLRAHSFAQCSRDKAKARPKDK